MEFHTRYTACEQQKNVQKSGCRELHKYLEFNCCKKGIQLIWLVYPKIWHQLSASNGQQGNISSTSAHWV